MTVNAASGIMNLTKGVCHTFRGGQSRGRSVAASQMFARPDPPLGGAMPNSFCITWPRRTIAVLVIILLFIVTLVVLGVAPLTAIGAAIVAAVVAATGEAPGTVPGL
jgi:hypothetical protein